MMINHKLLKLRATYQIAFEELLEDKDAEIPIDRSRLLDMKKMLLGYVNMSEKLLIGLEAALKKLLRCRMVRNKIVPNMIF